MRCISIYLRLIDPKDESEDETDQGQQSIDQKISFLRGVSNAQTLSAVAEYILKIEPGRLSELEDRAWEHINQIASGDIEKEGEEVQGFLAEVAQALMIPNQEHREKGPKQGKNKQYKGSKSNNNEVLESIAGCSLVGVIGCFSYNGLLIQALEGRMR